MKSPDVEACRFATVDDILTPDFKAINDRLHALNVQYGLPDHYGLNLKHYPWSVDFYLKPQIYATRLWEYPFAILSADLRPNMTCADIGCGMSPFPIYLMREAQCEVTGFDPDFIESSPHNSAFGVSQEFLNRTGLKLIQAGMELLPVPDSSFDRVFCISVIEHVPGDVARRGIQEIARVLKPKGLAIITVDINIFSSLCEIDHLSLIWESGLMLPGLLNLRWPKKRLGIFFKRKEPADVFAFVLKKDDYRVETSYSGPGGIKISPKIPGYKIPLVRDSMRKKDVQTPMPWRMRIKKALLTILQGYN